MSEQVNRSPTAWSVKGNIAPEEVSDPSVVDVFTTHNCTLTLGESVLIDGNLLTPVKATPDF